MSRHATRAVAEVREFPPPELGSRRQLFNVTCTFMAHPMAHIPGAAGLNAAVVRGAKYEAEAKAEEGYVGPVLVCQDCPYTRAGEDPRNICSSTCEMCSVGKCSACFGTPQHFVCESDEEHKYYLCEDHGDGHVPCLLCHQAENEGYDLRSSYDHDEVDAY